MKIFKPKFWHKKNSLISYLFLPISIFFQILIFCHHKITRIEKVSASVICVGNIYLGGTGKTPLSIEIAKILESLKRKTAIIKKDYKEHNDEFKLIKFNKVKLFKNSSRLKAIKNALKNKINCIVLDDGFQDMSINKDLNILCFNEKQLIGNGMTLPSGPLREPISSLERADIVVINGKINHKFEKKIKNISRNTSIYYSRYVPTNLHKFRNKKLLAFAGIGNPENFFNLLEKNNLKIVTKIPFPDHYAYSLKELNQLISFSLKNNLKIITTEKDFFRIKNFRLKKIEFLNTKLHIVNSIKFKKEIIKYL
ncbi:tetraacyldisaccharide 4'-kinase [Pelagibacteraceae bacterium]|nr:tetraacyldisaccharide 4'-kinase [Pelagibacteraceae bacterium]